LPERLEVTAFGGSLGPVARKPRLVESRLRARCAVLSSARGAPTVYGEFLALTRIVPRPPVNRTTTEASPTART